jgi:hypothetical protein
MFSSIAEIRTAVRDLLAPVLPASWVWKPNVDTLTTASAPTVYIEFTGISSTDEEGPLARGYSAPQLNLVVTDPLTDTAKAEDAVDMHLLRVLSKIEYSDDLHWSTASKRRLENGQLAWIIPLNALAYTPDPDPPTEE